MHLFRLFKLLKTLKYPKLDKKEWEFIAYIYNGLLTKTYTAFEDIYLKHHEPNGAIAEFMRCWFEIIDELKEFNKLIDDVLNKDTAADYRFFIFIKFLPTDVLILKSAAEKMELLSQVCPKQPEILNMVNEFLHAISYLTRHNKIQPIIPLKSHLSEEELNSIFAIIEKHLLIKKLKYFSQLYLDSIMKNIHDYLKNDKLCILYYSMFGPIHIPSLIKSELESLEYNAAHTDFTPLLKLLFDKYLKVKELLNVLNGTIRYMEAAEKDGDSPRIRTVKNAPVEIRLLTFVDSYSDYVNIFRKRIYDYTYNLFFGSCYTNIALEDKFLKTCDAIAEQLKVDGMRLGFY